MPTPEMRHAMATAPLGDDVFGDDPTVNQLEGVAAARLGKEAAVFLPSGTMGNVIGVAVNTNPGQEMIADSEAHVYSYEAAGAAVISGVQIRPVATEAGVMSPAQIEAALRPRNDFHQPITAAVSFEDTHNRHGGVVWPLADLRAASQAARSYGPRSPGRRQDVQRGRCRRNERRGYRRVRRHRHLLPFQGPRLPSRKHLLW